MTTQNEMPDEICVTKAINLVMLDDNRLFRYGTWNDAVTGDQTRAVKYIRADLTQTAGDVGEALGAVKQLKEKTKYLSNIHPSIFDCIERALSQQITKPHENVSCADLTNVGEALRFVKSIKIENVFYKDKPSIESQFRDAINTIERALSQQPDAGLDMWTLPYNSDDSDSRIRKVISHLGLSDNSTVVWGTLKQLENEIRHALVNDYNSKRAEQKGGF